MIKGPDVPLEITLIVSISNFNKEGNVSCTYAIIESCIEKKDHNTRYGRDIWHIIYMNFFFNSTSEVQPTTILPKQDPVIYTPLLVE